MSDETKRELEEEGGSVSFEEAKPPRKYKVLLHNDDYTTMEFVIFILQRFFSKSEEESMTIMMNVHNKGMGVCGIYSREVAETKVAQVTECARSEGHPLKCSFEKE